MSKNKNEDKDVNEFRFYCPFCEFKNYVTLPCAEKVECSNCDKEILTTVPDSSEEKLECCLCGYEDFYLVKDFNRALGVLIFVVGAILSIWTYGLSLAVAAIIDAILYKKLPFIKVCYICDSEYKGFHLSKEDKAFNHTLGDIVRPKREEWQINKQKFFSEK